MTESDAASGDTKACPLCGETIKKVAIRCKHCHAELKEPAADFDRGAPLRPEPQDFEQRFLEFAYKTTVVMNAASVAYALKIPIAEADQKLEDLAVSDVLIREVDDEGTVYFRLPGRATPSVSMVKHHPPGPPAIHAPPPPQAMMGLLLNLVVPGLGSIVAGKTVEGIIQLVLILIGLPLCFILIGIPLVIATWGWALSTGLRAMNEANATPRDGGSS